MDICEGRGAVIRPGIDYASFREERFVWESGRVGATGNLRHEAFAAEATGEYHQAATVAMNTRPCGWIGIIPFLFPVAGQRNKGKKM